MLSVSACVLVMLFGASLILGSLAFVVSTTVRDWRGYEYRPPQWTQSYALKRFVFAAGCAVGIGSFFLVEVTPCDPKDVGATRVSAVVPCPCSEKARM